MQVYRQMDATYFYPDVIRDDSFHSQRGGVLRKGGERSSLICGKKKWF